MSRIEHKQRIAASRYLPSVASGQTVDTGEHIENTSPGESYTQQFSDVSTAGTRNITQYLNVPSHSAGISPEHSGQITSKAGKRKRGESDSGRRDHPKFRRHSKQRKGGDKDVCIKVEKNTYNTEDGKITGEGKREREDTESRYRGKQRPRQRRRHTGSNEVDHVAVDSQTEEATRCTDSTTNSPMSGKRKRDDTEPQNSSKRKSRRSSRHTGTANAGQTAAGSLIDGTARCSDSTKNSHVTEMNFDTPPTHMFIKKEPISEDDQYTQREHEHPSGRRKRYSKKKQRKDVNQDGKSRNKRPSRNINKSEGRISLVLPGSGNETSISNSCSSVFGIQLKTEHETIKDEPSSDPDSLGESESIGQHRTEESLSQSLSRSSRQNLKLEQSVVNTPVMLEPSTAKPPVKLEPSTANIPVKLEPSIANTPVKLEPSTANTPVKLEQEQGSDPQYQETQQTSYQPQSVKPEPSTVHTAIKREPISDPQYSSASEQPGTVSQHQGVKLEPGSSTGIPADTCENGAVDYSEQARTSVQQQNGQDALPGTTDSDDEEREFQQFRLRRARRMDAKQHMRDTCSGIENHEYCTNVKAYLNKILENLPPEKYEQTAIMTEDSFFEKQRDKIMTEPFLETLFAMLYHKGVISREDICCIAHPLSTGSTRVFNLLEVLKRKPNGRKAFEMAAQDCLQDELLHEEPFDLARFNQLESLCFGDLPKLDQYFARKYSSEMDNLDEHVQKYSLLHYAAANGSLALYKQLETFFLLLKNDQEKQSFIQRHRDGHQNTVLHISVERGNEEVCGYLCSQYPFLTRSRNVLNQEPIHLAIACNKTNIKCLKYLMESNESTYPQGGSAIDGIASQNIQRLLYLAYTSDNVAAVKYLFTKYPSIKSQKGFRGRMPIHLAAARGGIGCFKYIEQLHVTGLHGDHKYIVMKELTEKDGCNALHVACESSSIAIISYIIQQYPQLLHIKDRQGREPIHHAIQSQGSLQSFVRVLNALNINKTTPQKLDYLIKARDHNGDTALHQACLLGRTDISRYLLKQYPTLIDERGFLGRQALHHAASKDGSIECFKCILDKIFQNKTVNDQLDYLKETKDYQSNTALHVACLWGMKGIVEYLLTKYPSLIDVKDSIGRQLLHLAANKDGTFECFKYILDFVLERETVKNESEYLTKSRDDQSSTVLHVACLSGRKDIVEYLLTKYPSLIDVKGFMGRQLLHDAANKNGTFECFKYILDFVLERETVKNEAEYLTKSRDDERSTVFHVACLCGRKDIVKYLLTKYPSLIDVEGFMGRQLLHTAAHKDGTFECFKYILDFVLERETVKNESEYLTKSRDDESSTVLHVACLSGRKDIVEYLLTKYPSFIDVKGFMGRQPLHAAASHKDGTFECFKFILDFVLERETVKNEAEYLTKSRDDISNTVLHVACLSGRKDIVKYLLTKYPSLIDVKGFMGRQLLHTAAHKEGTFEYFKYILDFVLERETVKNEAEYLTKSRDDQSSTVLHVACLSGRKDIVEYLLTKYPSLIDVKGLMGRQLLHSTAHKDGTFECFKYILDFVLERETVKNEAEYLTKSRDDISYTVLHVACLSGRKDIVKYLLTKYPSLIDVKGFMGRQLLHTAAHKDGTFECFKYILDFVLERETVKNEAEYLTKSRDDQSSTVLHVACLSGRKDIVKYLLTKYPSLIDVKGFMGKQLLHLAANKDGTFECFKYILDFVLERETVKNEAEYLTKSRDDESSTVLHVACSNGRKDIVEYLLTKYPSLIDVKGFMGRQLLHTAAHKDGTFECFKYILDFVLERETVKNEAEYLTKSRDNQSSTVLHVACLSGRKDIVKYLLTKYPSFIDVKGFMGRQLLHLAANKDGTFECFKYILDFVLERETVKNEAEYLTKSRDDESSTVLHVACLSGRKDIVKYLLTKYPSLIDVKGFMGKQLLNIAANKDGTFECFKYILDFVLERETVKNEAEYLTKSRDDISYTVLHVACLSGRKDIVKYLLTKYPSLIDVKGFMGKLLLHLVANKDGTFECFKYILDFVLERETVKNESEYLTKSRDDKSSTVLHVACLSGRKDIVEYLLTKYPSLIDVKGFMGRQLLHSVASHKDGTFECFKYILDFVLERKTVKNEAEYRTKSRDDQSSTVLHVACLSGRKDIVKYLLTKYPSLIDVEGFMGRQPLHAAASHKNGTFECFKFIRDIVPQMKTVEYQVEYLTGTREDDHNNTVLRMAVLNARKDIVEYLFNQFVSLIRVKGYDGKQQIHQAASLEGFKHILSIICGTNMVQQQIEFVTNTRNNENDTAAHVASRFGRKDILRFLLQRKPSLIDLEGCNGMTLLHSAATEHGTLKCFQYILRIANRNNSLEEQRAFLESRCDAQNHTVKAVAAIHGRNDVVSFLKRKYKSLK